MIIRREKNQEQIIPEILVKKNSVSTFNEDNIEIKTAIDESIEALNILEKQGINIYDPDNTPGMYLFNHSKTEIPVVLQHLLSKNAKKQKSINSEDSEDNSIPNNLLQFFKNKKL